METANQLRPCQGSFSENRKPGQSKDTRNVPCSFRATEYKYFIQLRGHTQNNVEKGIQKELAEAMECSPQYINKVIKGGENLQLETISKIGNILNLKLIEVPMVEKTT